jgi:hypothetical protein
MLIATVTIGTEIATLESNDNGLKLTGFLSSFKDEKKLRAELDARGVVPSITPLYVDLIEYLSKQPYATVVYNNVIPAFIDTPENLI